MKPETADGIGKRARLQVAGENYYLVGVRNDAGEVSFLVKTPDEHKATGQLRRETAERIIEAVNEMLLVL